MLILYAASILAAYPAQEIGSFSYNQQFQTHLYKTDKGATFCSLTTAPGTASNGIDYRFAIAFGDINEIRLVTETPLSNLKAIDLEFDDGSQFEFLDVRQTTVASNAVAYVDMSRPMMRKVLIALKQGGGTVRLRLPFGTPTFELPRADREDAYVGVKRCEEERLGKIVPD